MLGGSTTQHRGITPLILSPPLCYGEGLWHEFNPCLTPNFGKF